MRIPRANDAQAYGNDESAEMPDNAVRKGPYL